MDTTYLESLKVAQTQLSDGASIMLSVSWTPGPKKPDVLEIYVSFAPDESLPGPPLLETIAPDTKQPLPLKVSTIGKPAVLYFWLAPRLLDADQTLQAEMPDASGEDQLFPVFAAAQFFAIDYAAQAQPIAVATIRSIQGYPKLLHSPNHFLVVCSGSGGTIKNFDLIPTEDGVELEQLEAANGEFSQNSQPGFKYTFKAQAYCGESGWGPWTASQPAVGVQNLHSVAAFLIQSGLRLNPPARLDAILTQAKESSLRKLLGI